MASLLKPTKNAKRPIALRASKRHWTGFTLIEIMIVVAIITLLAVIAMPNFFRARKRAQAARIIDDLRALSSAVDQYAIEFGKTKGESITLDQVRPYVKTHTVLYETGKDVFGHDYQSDFTVDGNIVTPVGTWAALSDVTDLEFWSPFTLQ
jgi:prepilin-type N-terminal cleavage/methylation domain-containing protein